jgi:hypothetical protein
LTCLGTEAAARLSARGLPCLRTEAAAGLSSCCLACLPAEAARRLTAGGRRAQALRVAAGLCAEAAGLSRGLSCDTTAGAAETARTAGRTTHGV